LQPAPVCLKPDGNLEVPDDLNLEFASLRPQRLKKYFFSGLLAARSDSERESSICFPLFPDPRQERSGMTTVITVPPA